MKNKDNKDIRLTKEIYKSIGEFEITCSVEKLSICKKIQDTLDVPLSSVYTLEIFKHKNNVYVLNQTTLKLINLQSKKLKEKITSTCQMDLYKFIGYFLNINIKQDIKINKKLSSIDKMHKKTMQSLNVSDVYYYVSYAFGLPYVRAYKITSKKIGSIIVEECKLQKKITMKTIKYEIVGTTGESFLVKIHKNQAFNINGNEVVRANSNKIITKL